MSRLLSQDEVDALLSSFDSDVEQPALEGETLYDLRAPLVLAGDRLALVQAACEKLAHCLADVLSLLLIADKPVKGRFTGISQQPATTVLGTLAPGEPLGVLLDTHEEPVGGITLQPELALSILDRVQGGDGAVPQGARSLSNVEKRLLEESMRRMARHLDTQTALSPIHGGGLDRDPIFGRLATRGGTLAAAEFLMSTPHGDAACRLLLTPVLIHRLVADRRRGGPRSSARGTASRAGPGAGSRRAGDPRGPGDAGGSPATRSGPGAATGCPRARGPGPALQRRTAG
ncbi:MAG: hypothetical protein Q9Q13_14415 [Acidobacteriota bacterium]|nr:hypothetical protein [Acidobacteriota bacterium]